MPLVEGLALYTIGLEVKDFELLKTKYLAGFPLANKLCDFFNAITDPGVRRTCMDFDQYTKGRPIMLVGAGDNKEYSLLVELVISPPEDCYGLMERVRSTITIRDCLYQDVKLDYLGVYAQVLAADARLEKGQKVGTAQWHPVGDLSLNIPDNQAEWYRKVFEQAHKLIRAAQLNGDCYWVDSSVLYL